MVTGVRPSLTAPTSVRKPAAPAPAAASDAAHKHGVSATGGGTGAGGGGGTDTTRAVARELGDLDNMVKALPINESARERTAGAYTRSPISST